jgi:hypothetical protein
LLLEEGFGDVQSLGEVRDVLWGGLGLAVEESGSGDLIATNLLGDVFETELLLRLGGEQRLRGRWKVWVLGDLHGEKG